MFGLEYASPEIRAALRHLDGSIFLALTRRFPWLLPRRLPPNPGPFPDRQRSAGSGSAATHGLFMKGVAAALSESALERIVVTDTVPPFGLGDGPVKDKLTVLSSVSLFAEAIYRLHACGSITDLLES